MPPTNGFQSTPDYRWVNRHQTIDKQVDRYFLAENQGLADKYADYQATTQRIQDLIQRAIDNGKRLRALGAGWSLSEVALTDGFLLDTKPLNLAFQLGPTDLDPAYQGVPDNLLFVQCGGAVTELNDALENNLQKSLKTSGSSNGQTIAGALSTGTHGSAIDFGAFPEFVVGLHIIFGPERHLWLQRKTAPVVNQQWADRLGTTIVTNEDLFNAALVSFGSFGVIHGVLIEIEDRYLLESHLQWLPLDDVLENTICTLDFDDLALPHQPERPFHFEVVVNANDDPVTKVYVKTMYKRKYRDDYTRPVHTIDGRANGDDALAVLGRLATLVPIPGLFNKRADDEYAKFGPQFGTPGEIFSNENVRGKVLSVAMAVPLDSAMKALNVALTTFKQMHLVIPALVSLRYVKGTKATLGYTKFDKTCLLELDGIDTHEAQQFRNDVWDAMATSGIPYTFHWGKMNNLDAQKVLTMYGSAVTEWIDCRHRLLDAPSRAVFTNKFLENLGLAK